MKLLVFALFTSLTIVYGSKPPGFGQCRYSSIRGKEVKDVEYLEHFAVNWMYTGNDVSVPYTKDGYLVSSTNEEKLHEFRFIQTKKIVIIRFYVEFDKNAKLWCRTELCQFEKYELPVENKKTETKATKASVPENEQKTAEPEEENITENSKTSEQSVPVKEAKKEEPVSQKDAEKPKEPTTPRNEKVESKPVKASNVPHETVDVNSKKTTNSEETAKTVKGNKPTEQEDIKAKDVKKKEKQSKPFKFNCKKCLLMC